MFHFFAHKFGVSVLFGCFFYLSNLPQSGLAQLPPSYTNNVIEQHGLYSQTYLSDWSFLPNGNELARKNQSNYTYVATNGTSARRTWSNLDQVILTNVALKVTWSQSTYDDPETTLYTFSNIKTVIVDNVAIVQMNTNNTPVAYKTMHFKNCGVVIVTNCFLSGSARLHHISVEDCNRVLVDNVEIAGRDYSGTGSNIRCAGGISVNNGADGDGKAHGTPIWTTIQNCYIRDYIHSDTPSNTIDNDAVYIASPKNALVFNCYIENWFNSSGANGPVDAAIDVGHRRSDLTNSFIRLERNVVKNCTLHKATGFSGVNNFTFWANNVAINSYYNMYTGPAQVYYVQNTFICDTNKAYPGFVNEVPVQFTKINPTYDGPAFIRNNLVQARNLLAGNTRFQVYAASGTPDNRHTNMFPNFNAYLLDMSVANVRFLLGSPISYSTFTDWQNGTGHDANSYYSGSTPLSTNSFVDYVNDDYRIRTNSPAAHGADLTFIDPADQRMKVDRDFFGLPRGFDPSMGAFEIANTNLTTLPIVTVNAVGSAGEPSTIADFTISRSSELSSALTVFYSLSGSASNSLDYAQLFGTVTISPGASNAVVTILPVNDEIFEGNETITLSLSADTNYARGNPNFATMTLVDDDIPITQATEPFTGSNSAIAHGWIASNTFVNGNNFGFSSTDFTGFESPLAEAGGTFARTAAVSFFGDATLGRVYSLSDTLHADGELAITSASTNPVFDNAILIGFFNTASGGTVTRSNSLGLTINEPSPGGGQGTYRAKASFRLGSGASVENSALVALTPANSTYKFAIDYNPTGNGSLTIQVWSNAGTSLGTATTTLSPAQRGTNATFNSFGIVTGGIGAADANNRITLYVDALTYSSSVANKIPSIALNLPQRLSDGKFQFAVSGAVGQSCVLQASTNLLDWVSIATNTFNSTSTNFIDLQAGSFNTRFYRLLQTP